MRGGFPGCTRGQQWLPKTPGWSLSQGLALPTVQHCCFLPLYTLALRSTHRQELLVDVGGAPKRTPQHVQPAWVLGGWVEGMRIRPPWINRGMVR